MMMNRRAFSTALLAGEAASMISSRGMAANATPPKARVQRGNITPRA
ncbi:MAG TPA: hypothetical protein VK638_05345 [Edaphobacter sp.]|nr:hypothetical protein [Edaphobacter sp.]